MMSLRFPIPVINNNNLVNNQQKIIQNQLFSPQNPRNDQEKRRLFRSVKANLNTIKQTHSDNDAAGGLAVEALPEGLKRETLPRHVAIIMDGNVRWAKQRGLPSAAGHEAGVKSLREVIELCCRWGIGVLTVFAFSFDNWIRPKVEVDFLMSLFERVLKLELDNFNRQGIRISVIGDLSKLSKSLQSVIKDIEDATRNNTTLHLMVAVSYSGKYDVVQACKTIASKVKNGDIQLEDIKEGMIEQELKTNCSENPYPDLLIRTSGEKRISNFLLWQLAYTELFFAQALWPDFRKNDFVDALTSFQQRQRRYGGRT